MMWFTDPILLYCKEVPVITLGNQRRKTSTNPHQHLRDREAGCTVHIPLLWRIMRCLTSRMQV
jgi:hypothetical protein